MRIHWSLGIYSPSSTHGLRYAIFLSGANFATGHLRRIRVAPRADGLHFSVYDCANTLQSRYHGVVDHMGLKWATDGGVVIAIQGLTLLRVVQDTITSCLALADRLCVVCDQAFSLPTSHLMSELMFSTEEKKHRGASVYSPA